MKELNNILPGTFVTQAYGQTEATGLLTGFYLGDTEFNLRKPASCGIPLVIMDEYKVNKIFVEVVRALLEKLGTYFIIVVLKRNAPSVNIMEKIPKQRYCPINHLQPTKRLIHLTPSAKQMTFIKCRVFSFSWVQKFPTERRVINTNIGSSFYNNFFLD